MHLGHVAFGPNRRNGETMIRPTGLRSLSPISGGPRSALQQRARARHTMPADDEPAPRANATVDGPPKVSTAQRAGVRAAMLRAAKAEGAGAAKPGAGGSNSTTEIDGLPFDVRLLSFAAAQSFARKVLDSEREVGSERIAVSLVDSYSLARMKFPGRGHNCTHLRCFDIETFCKTNSGQQNNESCPCCSKSLAHRWSDLQ